MGTEKIILATDCPCCGHVHTVTVNFGDYCEFAYSNHSVWKSFPYLTATEREQLISGLCPDCQAKTFKEA